MPAHNTPAAGLLDWLRALPAQTSSDGATAGQVLVLSPAQRDAIVAVLTVYDADARAARRARNDPRLAADRALLQRAHRLLIDLEWAAVATGDPSCPFCGGLDVSGHADGCELADVKASLRVRLRPDVSPT